MLEVLFDAQIKIVQFCEKNTSFPFPTSDRVAQLFKNKMFVPFTPMEASGTLNYSVKMAMFIDAFNLCII